MGSSLTVAVSAFMATLSTVVWIFAYLGGLGSRNYPTYFNWHPLLMIFGLALVMSPSLLIYKVSKWPHASKKLFHSILNGFALVMFFIGLCIVYDFHNIIGAPHFYSAHSAIGLSFFALMLIQFLVGALFYYLNAVSSDVKRDSMQWHRSIGHFVLIAGLAAALMGINEKQGFISCDTVWCSEKRFSVFVAFMVVFLIGTYMVHIHIRPSSDSLLLRK